MPCCGALLWCLEGRVSQPFINSATIAFYPFDVGSYTLQTLLYSQLAGALVNVWSSEETRHLKAKMKSQFKALQNIRLLHVFRLWILRAEMWEGKTATGWLWGYPHHFFPFPQTSYHTPLYERLEQARDILAQLFQVLFACIYLHLLRIMRKHLEDT